MPSGNAAAQRVTALCQALEKYGHSIDVAGLNETPTPITLRTSCGSRMTRYLNFKYPKTLREKFNHLLSMTDFESLIDRNQYDMLVCYNHPGISTLKILSSRKKWGYKVILDLTEWYDSNNGGIVFKFAKWMDVAIRMRVAARYADGLILASRYLDRNYQELNEKIIVPTLVPALPKSVDQVTQGVLSDRKLVITYAGKPFDIGKRQRDPGKFKDRIDLIVDAFLKIKPEKALLQVYGISKEEYVSHIPCHSEMINNISSVKFYGKREQAEVVKAIENSDYTIFIRDDKRSNRAGFPTKLSESFEAGTPVITNEVGDAPVYVNDSNGFLVSGDPKGLSRDLERIVDFGLVHARSLRRNVRLENPLDINKWDKKINDFFIKIAGQS